MKILIYSVVTTERHYNEYIKYLKIIKNVEYLLFSSVNVQKNIDNVRVINVDVDDGKNLRELSRVYKMNAHKYIDLAKYDYYIYHDSNVIINEELLTSLYDIDKDIALYQHNRRKYIISEILYCFYVSKISAADVFRILFKIKGNVFLSSLVHGCVIIRRACNKGSKEFSELWLENYEYINVDRDQISLAVTVHKLNSYIYIYDSSPHGSKAVEIISHDKVVYKKNLNISKLTSLYKRS